MDLNRLSDVQQAAVKATEGPVLILAGAGSGKTGVLTSRVAYMISELHISPYSILAITFTNKAAKEMKERISGLIDVDIEHMAVSTFHSFCARSLRRCADSIGYQSGFSIYDTADSLDVIKKCAAERQLPLGKEITARQILNMISGAKNAFGRQTEKQYFDQHNPEFYEFYQAYNDRLHAENAMDFDDLLLKFLQALDVPEVRDYYQNRFRYVMVDEFQDTNSVQYQLVRTISEKWNNLFVVGDDDQSIYSWRGADIRNILEFEKDYPGATVIKLEQNYRSHQKILDAANAVIEKSEIRKQKKLWSANDVGPLPETRTLMNEYSEAEFVAHEINEAVGQGAGYDSFAILYRTHAQSRVIEEKMRMYAVPYHVYGGVSFYERKEVKDMIAYLAALDNPRSDTAVLRIINVPKRGIGDIAVARLRDVADAEQASILEVLVEGRGELASRAKFDSFVNLYCELSDAAENMGVGELLEEIYERTGYRELLLREENSESRMENVGELINAAYEYEKSAEEPSLTEFLSSIALFTDLDTMEETGSVALMTLHSAKGLEFDTVFMVGMEDSIFPSYRSITEGNTEEERRLCYVGMTRAKRRLYLTNCESRNVYGKTVYNMPSRFIKDIPPEMVENKTAPKKRAEKKEPAKRPSFGFRPAAMGEAAPAPKKSQECAAYSVGMTVEHKKFGRGRITKIMGEGDSRIAMIAFPGGEKKMFLAFAPLDIIK